MFFSLEILRADPLLREVRLREAPRFDFVFVQQPQGDGTAAVGIHEYESS
jgi:hypothetical protein